MIHPCFVGESYLVITNTHGDSAYCARWVRKAYRHLLASHNAHILSVRPTLDSLALEIRGTPDLAALTQDLSNLEIENASEKTGDILRVPVCYEESLAPDLAFVAERTGLSIPEVIQLHSGTNYEVWMLGFMPGYPYLGKLPTKLTLPRKDRPSPRISAGSVAVAEEYTGVYPFDSPGGWHIVGKTPWKVTDYRRTPPWLFDYGMQVQFYPITIEEYRQSISATTAT